MSRKTSWIVGCIALASVFALLVSPAQASLIVGFKFADGSTSVSVPASGGVYTVNVVAVTDNANVTSLGISTVYYGGLSAVLNSNLGNGTLDGDVTAGAVHDGSDLTLSSNAEIQDDNADGRDDLGPITNSSVSNRSPATFHPWWAVAQNAGPSFYSNAASAIIGTFTVTIPAYTPNGNVGNFLSYTPTLQVSSLISNYALWSELTTAGLTNRAGKFNTAAGNTNLNTGTSVLFAAVPEPATLVLMGLAGIGLISFCRPKRKS